MLGPGEDLDQRDEDNLSLTQPCHRQVMESKARIMVFRKAGSTAGEGPFANSRGHSDHLGAESMREEMHRSRSQGGPAREQSFLLKHDRSLAW